MIIAKMFPKKIDKLYFGLIFWDNIIVIKATIIENNNTIYPFVQLLKSKSDSYVNYIGDLKNELLPFSTNTESPTLNPFI